MIIAETLKMLLSYWHISSVGREYMSVTHEVTGSSPVCVATNRAVSSVG